MKLKNETKVGFDKINFTFKKKEELLNECKKYRDNIIDIYIKTKLSMIEPLYIQKLCNIEEKYKNKNPRNQSIKSEKFINVKQKIIDYLIEKRKNELVKKYNKKFDDDSLNKKAKQALYKISDIFTGIYNGIVSSITFNLVDLRKKENKSELLENLINGEEETKYLKD